MSWSADVSLTGHSDVGTGIRLPHPGVSIEVSAARFADGRAQSWRLRLDRRGLSWSPIGRPGAVVSVVLGDIRAVRLVGSGAALEVEVLGGAHRFGGDGGRRIYDALVECLVPEAA